MDFSLVEFLNHRFPQGPQAWEGEMLLAVSSRTMGTLLSAIMHLEPRFGRNGEKPYHAHTELQGWKRLALSCAWLPLPSVGLMAMVGSALHAT